MESFERPKSYYSLSQLFGQSFGPVEDELRSVYARVMSDLRNCIPDKDQLEVLDVHHLIVIARREVYFAIRLSWEYRGKKDNRTLQGKIRRVDRTDYKPYDENVTDGHSKVIASFFQQFGWKPLVASWDCQICKQTSESVVDMTKEFRSETWTAPYMASIEILRERDLCDCARLRLRNLYRLFTKELS